MSRLLLEVTAVSIILTFYVFLCNLILFAGVASICKCCTKYKFSKRRYNPFNFEKLYYENSWIWNTESCQKYRNFQESTYSRKIEGASKLDVLFYVRFEAHEIT